MMSRSLFISQRLLLLPPLVLLLSTMSSTVTCAHSTVMQEPPPSTGEAWVTLGQGLEFQPSAHQDWNNPKLRAARDEAQSRLLGGSTSSYTSTAATATLFVDSQYREYNGYQQAWRYMGFYIDCSTANQAEHKDDHHRHLPGEDDHGGGGSMGCTRYLLWAAVRAFLRMDDRVGCQVSILLTLPKIFLYVVYSTVRGSRL